MAVLIQGGTVVTAEGETRADVLCVGETIAAIGPDQADLTGNVAVEPARGHLLTCFSIGVGVPGGSTVGPSVSFRDVPCLPEAPPTFANDIQTTHGMRANL